MNGPMQGPDEWTNGPNGLPGLLASFSSAVTPETYVDSPPGSSGTCMLNVIDDEKRHICLKPILIHSFFDYLKPYAFQFKIMTRPCFDTLLFGKHADALLP